MTGRHPRELQPWLVCISIEIILKLDQRLLLGPMSLKLKKQSLTVNNDLQMHQQDFKQLSKRSQVVHTDKAWICCRLNVQ